MKDFIRTYLLSPDTGFALAVAIALAILGPQAYPVEFAKDAYSTGIAVLSIVFSVFFAAMANIISASDDEFVMYLLERDHYRQIIDAFRVTLFSLGVALASSVVLYLATSLSISLNASSTSSKVTEQSSFWFVGFAVLFTYGMGAAFGVAMDAIRWAKARSVFLENKKLAVKLQEVKSMAAQVVSLAGTEASPATPPSQPQSPTPSNSGKTDGSATSSKP